MLKKFVMKCMVLMAVTVATLSMGTGTARAEGVGQPYDWNRFYYYPYVYYPHNFQKPTQYNSLYYRYPAERRIPVYRTDWHNMYPSPHPYHSGHAFILDVF